MPSSLISSLVEFAVAFVSLICTVVVYITCKFVFIIGLRPPCFHGSSAGNHIRCNGNNRIQECTYKPSSCLLYTSHHRKRISAGKVAYLPCASKGAFVGEDIPSASLMFRESFRRNVSKRKVEGWSCNDGGFACCDASANSSGTDTQNEKEQVFKVFPEELISSQPSYQPLTAFHLQNQDHNASTNCLVNQVSMEDIDHSTKNLQHPQLECPSNDMEQESENNVNHVNIDASEHRTNYTNDMKQEPENNVNHVNNDALEHRTKELNDMEHEYGNNLNHAYMEGGDALKHGTSDMEVCQVSDVLPCENIKQTDVSGKSKDKIEDSSVFGGLKSIDNEAMDRSRENSSQSDDDPLSIRKKLHVLRSDLKKKYIELEKQRSVSALSVDEAMSMIASLQKEKATIEMEAVQLQRMLEEKESFDESTINDLRDQFVKQEAEMLMLEKEMEVCRRKIVMCRLKDSGEERIIDETQTQESVVSPTEKRNNNFLLGLSRRPVFDFRTQSMIVRDKNRDLIKQEVSSLVTKLTTVEADREVMKHTIELKKRHIITPEEN